MKKEDLKPLFAEFERQALEEQKANTQARKSAVGILKGQAIQKARARGQGIVLAYGMAGQVSYSLEELNAFVKTIERHQAKSGSDKGVTRAALLRASRPIDKQRAKAVRNATLYQRKGNIVYFQAPGNSRPFYRVQIRLEEWDNAVAKQLDPVLVAARKILAGRISFECPCERHQYWYRYMASIGNYGLKPIETGYPKIRNRKLEGCCCKHVLKVLQELQSSRVVFILSKELEKARASKTYSGVGGKRLLSEADLRLARGKRISAAAKKAFKKYEAEAEEYRKKLKPRSVTTPEISAQIGALLKQAKALGLDIDQVLAPIRAKYSLTKKELAKIIKESNL